jgi:hypothetical protein
VLHHTKSVTDFTTATRLKVSGFGDSAFSTANSNFDKSTAGKSLLRFLCGMPPHTRYVPPEQTIVVKGLQRHEVLAVKGFVARYTNALGVAVHADCADKETVRSLLYCNFRTPQEAENAMDGVVQFMLQTFPKISEHHQVLAGVHFARRVCLPLCSVCARPSVQVARAASACRCFARAGVSVQVELRVLTGALRALASRCKLSCECLRAPCVRWRLRAS